MEINGQKPHLNQSWEGPIKGALTPYADPGTQQEEFFVYNHSPNFLFSMKEQPLLCFPESVCSLPLDHMS